MLVNLFCNLIRFLKNIIQILEFGLVGIRSTCLNNWTFTKSRYKRLRYTLFIFVFIYFMGGLEMTLIINIVDRLIQNHIIAWICGAFVAAMNNYLGSKYLLFHD